MEKIPLHLRLKKESHRKIAYAQDLIVKEIYKKIDTAILHGGTAIWRCYNGKRFSEDLDFYLPKNKIKIDEIFENLKKIGFNILKKKISEKSVYSHLEFERVSVRFEATFQKPEMIIADYETIDGTIISIYSLTPEAFIKEKAQTYIKRHKVRDLWDIFFLLKFVRNFSLIKKELENLIKNYEKPEDEEDLKIIILEGIVPSSKEIFGYIRTKWEKGSI